MKAIIFAAGLGTRLQPLTLNKPKALVEINGTTLLELAIRKLIQHGFTDIIINVHAFGNQIIEFVSQHYFEAQITISDERDLLLDTGGGLAKALPFFSDGEPFLVYNVDIVTTLDLHGFYEQHLIQKPLASLMVRKRNTSRQLLFDREMNLSGWRNSSNGEEIWVSQSETVATEEFAFSGIHIVDPRISKYIKTENTPFPIVPFYLEVAKHEPIKGVVDKDSVWFDVGKVEQLKEAEKFLSLTSQPN